MIFSWYVRGQGGRINYVFVSAVRHLVMARSPTPSKLNIKNSKIYVGTSIIRIFLMESKSMEYIIPGPYHTFAA